ncbi:hypothetical protein CNMCM7691_008769 [Aspergillus felis]|uniref:Uncharacterized protein n=1 Tax=Aspergillus felis TaxID=1287682 RepID=A0A8H6QVW2_9EURO|nr:hypothetical protein CNMCM7691_008769 [Aspergillus felis]
MVPVFKTLALASTLFAAISSAVPVNLNEREDLGVCETVTTVDWTSVDVTTTVYPAQQVAAITGTVAVVSAGSTLTTAPAPGKTKTTESQRNGEVGACSEKRTLPWIYIQWGSFCGYRTGRL